MDLGKLSSSVMRPAPGSEDVAIARDLACPLQGQRCVGLSGWLVLDVCESTLLVLGVVLEPSVSSGVDGSFLYVIWLGGHTRAYFSILLLRNI